VRLREFLLNTSLMFFALIAAKAQPLVKDGVPGEAGNESTTVGESAGPALPAAPSTLIAQDKVLASAYYDTVGILSTHNACSDFFGRPDASVGVFNQLVSSVRMGSFPPSTGLRMSGETTNVLNAKTMKQYRIFEKVLLNTNGPFYRKQFSVTNPQVHRIGSFDADTKEVRVLIFLHELGHLIRGDDGKWLLPDDGRSDEISRKNSQNIEEVCSEQIHNLSKQQARNTRQDRDQPGEKTAPLTSAIVKP